MRDKWKINEKTDWNKYRKKINLLLENNDTVNYEELTNVILNAAKQTIGFKKPNRRRQQREPRNIRKLIAKRKTAEKLWMIENNPAKKKEKWADLIKLRDKVKEKRCERSKRIKAKEIQKLIAKGGQNGRYFWSTINSLQQKNQSITKLTIEDKEIYDEDKIIEEIEKYLENLITEDRIIDGPNYTAEHNWEEWEHICKKPLIAKELLSALNCIKDGKAVGTDNIPCELIKYGGEKLHSKLLHVMNNIKSMNSYPSSWYIDRCMLLHKGGKKDSLDNYRTISIGQSTQKIFSTIIQTRVLDFIESKGLLGQIQNAFRPNRGTIDHLFTLTHIIENQLGKNRNLYIAFIDLRKAFDRVWRPGLLAALIKEKIAGPFKDIIEKMYKHTEKFITNGNNKTKSIRASVGVKQGCVLSPLLFNILMAELGRELEESNLGVQIGSLNISAMFYADDIALISDREAKMMTLLQKTADYMSNNHLEINYKKSQIMNLSRRKGINWSIKVKNENIKLNETTEYKYLGITINNSKKYLKNYNTRITVTAKRKLGITKLKSSEATNQIWALNALWKQMAMSGALYAVETIHLDNNTIQELEKMEYDLGLWATKVRRGTAKAAIKAELGWGSIALECDRRKLIYMEKIKKMDKDRWPNILLDDIIKGNIASTWFKDALRANHGS
jgi:hypothetical protein